MKRIAGGLLVGAMLLGEAGPAVASTAPSPAGRQYLADVAPYNRADAALLVAVRRDEKKGSSGTLAVLDAPVAALLRAGTLFDLLLVRQEWPPQARGDVLTLARAQAIVNDDLSRFRFVTTGAGVRRWSETYSRDASASTVDAQIVRADLGLPAAPS